MIWNPEMLFLHPQKTAGMALTTALLNTLRPTIFLSVPSGHLPPNSPRGVAFVSGMRHENLYQARELLCHFGKTLSDFTAILVTIRNPYDLEVSRYFHLRKPEVFETSEEPQWARTLPFHDFQLVSEFRLPKPEDPNLTRDENLESYYRLEGVSPSNLRILRYEHIEHDLNEQLARFGYPPANIIAENWSPEREARPFTCFISSSEVEQKIYERYSWVFDSGLYPRMNCQATDADGISQPNTVSSQQERILPPS